MYDIIIHTPHKTHSRFDNLFEAAKVARKLNTEHGYEYCYIYSPTEKQVYNPRYCRPVGERFGSPG
jgi:hypothetical protein